MSKVDILIIGAGGHSKVVYSTLVTISRDYVLQFADDVKKGQLYSIPIVTLKEALSYNPQLIHLAIGDNATRRKLVEQYNLENLLSIQHQKAIVSEYSSIGQGCFIAASAIVSADATVGLSTIINHQAIIDHDCKIGSYCHIAPSAALGGNVTIGDGVFVGANATILPGILVDDWAVIGAGAVVTKNIKKNQVVKGVPAR